MLSVIKNFIVLGLLVLMVFGMVEIVFAEELITGGQSPEKTVNSIFRPITNFFNRAAEFLNQAIQNALDFNWWQDLVLRIFEAIDSFIFGLTGRTIGEILKMIGELLVSIFNLMIGFAKKLWPF